MSELEDLKRYQKTIHEAYGYWNGPSLAGTSDRAAGQARLQGDGEAVLHLAQAVGDGSRSLFDAAETLGDLRKVHVDGVWAGDAHIAASVAIAALHDDVVRACTSFQKIADRLRIYGEQLAPLPRRDEDGAAALRQAADQADAHNTLGGCLPPDPFDYDNGVMQAAHRLAMDGIDTRVGVHASAVDNAQDFSSAMHDIAEDARARGLDGPFSPLDAVVLAGTGLLSPAMETRVHSMFSTLDPGGRERLLALLAAASSAQQRAYLLRALAAGYSVDEVARFNAMIDGHDPGWLAAHLNPLTMDGAVAPGKLMNSFEGRDWTQGSDPTCVASSTVTARAAVDPLYALQLTTGGHPGDHAFDNPKAFAERLKDEQFRVYDGDRHWYENWFNDGMTNEQSERVAEKEISAHTGAPYQNVEVSDTASRTATLRQAERAVDDGYPVPFSTFEGDRGHQMMIIGHSGDQVQIYNPWGYTFWLSEDDFTSGNVDRIDTDIPRLPGSIRLPQEANR